MSGELSLLERARKAAELAAKNANSSSVEEAAVMAATAAGAIADNFGPGHFSFRKSRGCLREFIRVLESLKDEDTSCLTSVDGYSATVLFKQRLDNGKWTELTTVHIMESDEAVVIDVSAQSFRPVVEPLGQAIEGITGLVAGLASGDLGKDSVSRLSKKIAGNVDVTEMIEGLTFNGTVKAAVLTLGNSLDAEVQAAIDRKRQKEEKEQRENYCQSCGSPIADKSVSHCAGCGAPR